MDRIKTLLQKLDLSALQGIEIGALDRPLVPKSQGRIFYVDFTDTETLRRNYTGHPYIRADRLVQVEGIWGRNTLREAAAAVAPADYVVASHVIEHVPDLIAWLEELRQVLKDDGEIRLAIPDRRYTFDYYRAETRLADVLDPHLFGARIPGSREVIDYVMNATPFDSTMAWNGGLPEVRRPWALQAARAVELARDVVDNKNYHDSHCWVFTPHSFASLMEMLAETGYLKLKCEWLQDTGRNQHEFFVAMRPCDDAQQVIASWRAAAGSVEAPEEKEQAAQAELEGLRSRCGALEAERSQLTREVQALRTSSSWRLTAPLRALKRAFGQGAG